MIEIGITIIDAHCGAGKTSWAKRYMREHQKTKCFIYITPYLSEIDNIMGKTDDETKNDNEFNIFDPQERGRGKLDSLNYLLSKNYNIAMTHALFAMINDETRALMTQNDYTIIIDESLDVVNEYKGLKKSDRDFLINSDTIKIDQYGYVIWNQKHVYDGYKYFDEQCAAQNHCLISVEDKMFLWQFPPDIFNIVNNIYIMTYMFEASIMCAYFKYHNIKYKKQSVIPVDIDNRIYELSDYHKYTNPEIKSLINICEINALNKIADKRGILSSTWYSNNCISDGNFDIDKIAISGKKIDNKTQDKIKTTKSIRNKMTNYIKNIIKAPSDKVMWTTYKDYESNLSDDGRKFTRRLTKSEKTRYTAQYNKRKLDTDLAQIKCFVSCNARATNEYRDRDCLLYMCNIFLNPMIKNFFAIKNVTFDDDKYALSAIIQWIYRSALREGKPISLYVPSSRMREILKNWIQQTLLLE